MVKTEAFDDSHFMHQAVRGGHSDHTGSIVSLMACIFDLKKKFLCNRQLIKIVLLSEGYSLGMVKTEAFDDSHFMHQAVRGGHTDHTGSMVSLMACIFDLKKKFLCNRKLIKIVLPWYGENGSVWQSSFYAPVCHTDQRTYVRIYI